MKKSLIAAALASALCLVNESKADSREGWSPLGLGLCAPVQFPTSVRGDVYGLRLGGLYGAYADVYGLDVTLVGAQEHFVGLQVAAVGLSQFTSVGLQATAVSVNTTFTGLQVAALNWNNADSLGVQFAAVNANQSDFTGWAAGALNASLRFTGFQLGAFNMADDVTGFQLGVVNAAQRLYGLQVGLLNLVCESSLPIMVLANASF